MAEYMNMDFLKYILKEVHGITDVFGLERHQDYDLDMVDILLQSAKDFADKEMFPFFTEMDRTEVVYKDGRVIAHPQLKQIMRIAGENGWVAPYFDYDEGGSQMPYMLYTAHSHILEAANNGATGYIELTAGALNLIRTFGTKEQFEQFSTHMLAGEWGGTMALTEPQSGSSLADIKTSAQRTEDGFFKIKGQKIFISGGDYQGVDNIVHLTLARIEGATSGTRGISLFIIPKKRLSNDGTLESNDVFTAGEFEKLGQKGYVTTHLVFGDHDDCHGYLVGDENMGLKYMFQMMNGARLAVGLTAVSTATAAYYASLQYAKERPQGRKLNDRGKKNINAPQTLIINHPDVRRMLFLQKALTEGSLLLLMQCARYRDFAKESGDPEERKYYSEILEVLTPIAKTFPSEKSMVSISNGLQILGGYGYTKDFPLEQYYRDIRIMPIYEGTTGIQSLDLLGRKVTMNNGESLKHLIKEIFTTIHRAKAMPDLKKYAEILEQKLDLSQKVLQYLLGFAVKGDYERFLSDATIFMDFASTMVIAWQWLKSAAVAKKALLTNNQTFRAEFYEGQIHSMRFYFKYEVSKMDGMAQILMDDEVLTIVGEKEQILN